MFIRSYIYFKDICLEDLTSRERVEMVVLLSRQTPDDYLETNVELDNDFLTKAEFKGTYDQIKQYI